MEIRKATLKDVDSIMCIVKDSQSLLAKEKVDQWQDGFPNEDIIKFDIENWESYVFVDEGDKVGFFAISLEDDEGYKNIYDGKWLTNEKPYATLHRTAFSSKVRGKGLSKLMFDFCEDIAKKHSMESIRVDTHEDNKRMRHIIERQGYTYCGYIFLAISGSKRVVYEKLL